MNKRKLLPTLLFLTVFFSCASASAAHAAAAEYEAIPTLKYEGNLIWAESSICAGESGYLGLYFKDLPVDTDSVTWSSKDSGVADVEALVSEYSITSEFFACEITAIKEGKTTISAYHDRKLILKLILTVKGSEL